MRQSVDCHTLISLGQPKTIERQGSVTKLPLQQPLEAAADDGHRGRINRVVPSVRKKNEEKADDRQLLPSASHRFDSNQNVTSRQVIIESCKYESMEPLTTPSTTWSVIPARTKDVDPLEIRADPHGRPLAILPPRT